MQDSDAAKRERMRLRLFTVMCVLFVSASMIGASAQAGPRSDAALSPTSSLGRACARTYVVRRGDGWYRISRAAGVPVNVVLAANAASRATKLHPGMTVCLAPAAPSLFAPPHPPPPSAAAWLDTINQARVAAGVGPVKDAPAHVRAATTAAAVCLSRNGQQGNPHLLDRARSCGPGVDPASAAQGAAQSNISFSAQPRTERVVVLSLLSKPFHGMNLLYPGRRSMAFASSWNPDGPVPGRRFVVAINTEHAGRNTGQTAAASVIAWPPPNWPVAGRFDTTSEWPSPLEPCGLQQSGPPIWMATPSMATPPALGNVMLLDRAGQVASPLCIYTADGLNFADRYAQGASSGLMKELRAVIIIPTSPLAAGTYQLTGTINGRGFSRSMSVSG